MSVCKKVMRDTPVQNGVPVNLFLPAELWQEVVKWWPNNYELEHVCGLRTLNRCFAECLFYRVHTHHPQHARAIMAMRLLYTFNRRRLPNGTDLYARAVNTVFCRFTEQKYKAHAGSISTFRGDAFHNCYFHALVGFMETQGQLMPPAFDGFVARIHHIWARHYTSRRKLCDLETIFKKVRHGARQSEGTDWMALTGAAVAVDDDD
jgi:hypothetical protein